MITDDVVGRLENGEALYRRALQIIPWGSQTNSKRPPESLRGAYPPYIERGEGACVWDLDGNRYIDHKLGCGPVILGHAYPAVVEAAAKQMHDGIVYGSAHPSEVVLAELLIEVVPCAEMVRFLKTGAEGTSAAVRIARACTGRDLILSYGYHGWHDWSTGVHEHEAGIPACVRALTIDLPFGDGQLVEDLFRDRGDEIAAVVFSAPYDQEPAAIGNFLRKLRSLTEKHGAVLVYDEIVTGFRVSMGGLQELVGVLPDLAVFSKGMANGFPISAVVGREEVMRTWDGVFISSTFAGDAVSIAAAIACIHEVREKNVPRELAQRGAWLKSRAEAIAAEQGLHLRGLGFDPAPALHLQDQDAHLAESLHRALLLEGVMPMDPLWYLSYSHDMRVLEESVAALKRAMAGVVALGGK